MVAVCVIMYIAAFVHWALVVRGTLRSDQLSDEFHKSAFMCLQDIWAGTNCGDYGKKTYRRPDGINDCSLTVLLTINVSSPTSLYPDVF